MTNIILIQSPVFRILEPELGSRKAEVRRRGDETSLQNRFVSGGIVTLTHMNVVAPKELCNYKCRKTILCKMSTVGQAY